MGVGEDAVRIASGDAAAVVHNGKDEMVKDDVAAAASVSLGSRPVAAAMSGRDSAAVEDG